MTLFSFNSERFQRRRGREKKKDRNLWLNYIYGKKGKKNCQNLHSVPLLVKENK